MTPSEKAEELYLKYKGALNIRNDMRPGKNPFANECAIICVEQIIEEWTELNDDPDTESLWSEQKQKYWQEVLDILKSS